MNHYKNAFRKYADFKTRARRSEYWYFALFNAVFILLLSLLDTMSGFGSEETLGIFGGLYSLVVVIPSLAVCVRRLHDIGKSGWWIFIAMVPFIGAIVLLLFAIRDSQPGANQYGPNPKESNDSKDVSDATDSVSAQNSTSKPNSALPVENNFTRPTSPIMSTPASDTTPPSMPTSNLS